MIVQGEIEPQCKTFQKSFLAGKAELIGPRWTGLSLINFPAVAGVQRDGRPKMARSMQNILSRNLRQLPIFSGPNGMSAIAMRPFYFRSHPNGDHRFRRLKDWLAQNAIEALNVEALGHPRKPGIASFVIHTLDAVFEF
jgi:hypothetical protein